MKGTGVSNGIGIAKAFLLIKKEIKYEKDSAIEASEEMRRFTSASEKFIAHTEKMRDELISKAGEAEAAILDTQILKNPEIVSGIQSAIYWDGKTAEYALTQVFDNFTDTFTERNSDIISRSIQNLNDIKNRLIEILTGCDENPIDFIAEPCILVAHELTPSDIARINKEYVKAVVSETGGYTSHSAIMSRAMDIPAILGASGAMNAIENGHFIIADGSTGDIIIQPSSNEVARYEKMLKEFLERKMALKQYKGKKTMTLDGYKTALYANISGLADLEAVLSNNAEGIGLFRTEFLFIDRDTLPTEEEQFEIYKKAAEAMKGKPVIIRTMDIGGDKDLPSVGLIKEDNPFLGFRGIRMCLQVKNIFKVQLKALLRASAFGNIKIMLPMVSCVEEIRQTADILEELKTELSAADISYNNNIELGIMIETPSAAVMADVLVKEAAFISIGTNDLTQYTLAVDRGNEKVSYLYEVFNPAVMRLIANIIFVCKREKKSVGMCGEAAGYPQMIPFLIAAGLDEFSMTASSILSARKLISALNKKELEGKLPNILALSTVDEVKEALEML